MRTPKFLSVSDFSAQKQQFIDSSFTLPEVYSSRPTSNRLYLYVQYRFGALVNLFSPIYCLLRLLIHNPKIVRAQFFLRRGGLKGSYQWVRLWELKGLLDRHSPSSILEFGSGGSTVLFSHYAKSAGAKFESIEEDSDWRETVLLSAKKAGLDDLPKFESQVVYCRRLENLDSVTSELVCHYELSQFHTLPWDFVYVDGPTNYSHRSHSEGYCADPAMTLPNVDTASLSHRPSVIVIDGRRSTVRYLVRTGLFEEYKVSLSRKYMALALHWPLFRNPYHTIFVR